MLTTQTRGEPYLSPIIELLADLKTYAKNELRAAVVSGQVGRALSRLLGMPVRRGPYFLPRKGPLGCGLVGEGGVASADHV